MWLFDFVVWVMLYGVVLMSMVCGCVLRIGGFVKYLLSFLVY